MRKVISYIAISLNGKIARPDGAVDWLDNIPNAEKEDHGFFDFYKDIDTTIMGNATYQLLLSWNVPFPYPGKKNFIFTRNPDLVDNENVQFISSDHIAFTEALKKEDGKDIWLIGGGQVNTLLFNAGLLDEMMIFVMPVVIPSGINLFENIPAEKLLDLLDAKKYSSGVVLLHYKLT